MKRRLLTPHTKMGRREGAGVHSLKWQGACPLMQSLTRLSGHMQL